jgi:methylated-DNA-[protein]-cysteine S-methyltransferase
MGEFTMNSSHNFETAVFITDLGWMSATVLGDTLCELSFGHPSPRSAWTSLRREHTNPVARPGKFLGRLMQRLQSFAHEPSDDFLDVQLDLSTFTEFQRVVLQRCREIPIGETVSYLELARQAGRPRAARAVGQVMAHNRFPLVVPCHRVVGTGSLGGYSARDGLALKRRLLQLEETSSRAVSV